MIVCFVDIGRIVCHHDLSSLFVNDIFKDGGKKPIFHHSFLPLTLQYVENVGKNSQKSAEIDLNNEY